MTDIPIEQLKAGDRVIVNADTLEAREVTVDSVGVGIACGRGGYSVRMVFVHWTEDGREYQRMGYAGRTLVRLPEEAPGA